ncbi:hypothetical protein SPRG_11197 [Saprolegnia parasitica CBS 223.65]|uniref:PX domain-containing protein n=1 Tax=Saprolegnia parasitica (strain CBS 223.65) TaxID=695850 RepID=A0A067C8Z5_SAPPC|nr:hypothetical protein SPRG_11197 [Saprolegnia parasitica CBS 223.65]KDO23267.1 hypothetical protein SPRG_11197 [Saprolegnia parasitica CBS 223.65]|eukprot:XP_012206055.1 hypothetical protein SPRG_11197 [Saprolegnia parasitica CBS 223.65]
MGCTQSSTIDENVQIATINSVSVAPPDDVVVTTSYVISTTSVDGNGVVLYHIETDGVVAKKRFNDFKVFHSELTTVIEAVPALPDSGLATVFKRRDEKLIKERSARFQEILDAAAAHAADRLQQFVVAAVTDDVATKDITVVEEINVVVVDEAPVQEPVADAEVAEVAEVAVVEAEAEAEVVAVVEEIAAVEVEAATAVEEEVAAAVEDAVVADDVAAVEAAAEASIAEEVVVDDAPAAEEPKVVAAEAAPKPVAA